VHHDPAGVDVAVCERQLVASRSSVGCRGRNCSALDPGATATTAACLIGRMYDTGSVCWYSRAERCLYRWLVDSKQSSAGRRRVGGHTVDEVPPLSLALARQSARLSTVATRTPNPTLEMALLFTLIALLALIWFGVS
jgi:hypothetical protein